MPAEFRRNPADVDRSLGVDLSTNPKRTALCLLEWSGDGSPAQVGSLVVGASDDAVIHAAESADYIGVDAPFGWPKAWTLAVAAHRPGDPFAADGSPAELTRRYTDTWIASNIGIRPLPVAANLIGATAIRCARLVAALGRPVDTGGDVHPGSVSEVYPAAALKRWGQSFTLYKGRQRREARLALVAALIGAGLPVRLTPGQRVALEANDDALDALIASLVARAIFLGLTEDCPPEAREFCRSEGWIRVPAAGSSLRDLVEQSEAAL